MLSVYYIGIVQAFFAALLIAKKENKASGDKVLIVWLLIIGIEMIYSLLNLTYLKSLPDLIIIPFAYGPLLWLYTKSQVLGVKTRKSTTLYHFIPLLIVFILAFFWNGPESFHSNEILKLQSYTIINFLNYMLFIVSMLWYWLLVFKLLKQHKEQVSKSLSFENEKVKLSWVKAVAWWILGAFILSGLTYIFFIIKNIYPFNPIEIYHVGLLIFIFSISYYGIHQPNVIRELKVDALPKKLQDNYSDKQLKELGVQIHAIMAEQKPYLNRELSFQQFVGLIGENHAMISYYLNHYLNKNFFTFINEYRVNEAKQLIADPKLKHLTLLAIGYEAGFNSKSSFNSIFKKVSGETPSDYKKMHESFQN